MSEPPGSPAAEAAALPGENHVGLHPPDLRRRGGGVRKRIWRVLTPGPKTGEVPHPSPPISEIRKRRNPGPRRPENPPWAVNPLRIHPYPDPRPLPFRRPDGRRKGGRCLDVDSADRPRFRAHRAHRKRRNHGASPLTQGHEHDMLVRLGDEGSEGANRLNAAIRGICGRFWGMGKTKCPLRWRASILGGGRGGIRTPGAFAQRFSRPPP
jgi:hypothetical protein